MGQQLGQQCASGCAQSCSYGATDHDDVVSHAARVHMLHAVVDPATGAHLTEMQQRVVEEMMADCHDGASESGAAPCGDEPPCGVAAFTALEEFLRKSPKAPHDAEVRADEKCALAPESSPQNVRLSDASGMRGKPRLPRPACDEPDDCMQIQPASSAASTEATSDSQSSHADSMPSRRRCSQTAQLESHKRSDRKKDTGNSVFGRRDNPALDFPAPRPRAFSAPVPEKHVASIASTRHDGMVVSDGPKQRPKQGSRSVGREWSDSSGQGLGLYFSPQYCQSSAGSRASTSIPEDSSPRSRASTMTTVDEASPRFQSRSRRRASSILDAADTAKDQIAIAHASRACAAPEPKAEPWLEPLPSASDVLSRQVAASVKQDERRVKAIVVRWIDSEVAGGVRRFHSMQGHTAEARSTSVLRIFTDLELPDKRDLRVHFVVAGLPVQGGHLSVGLARRKMPGMLRVAPKGTPLGRVDDSLGMVVDGQGVCSLEAEDEIVEEHVCGGLSTGSLVDIHWECTRRLLFFGVDGKEVGMIEEVPEVPYFFAASLSAGCSVILSGAD